MLSPDITRLGSIETALTTMQQAIATKVGSQNRPPETIFIRPTIVTMSASPRPPKKHNAISVLRYQVRGFRYSARLSS